MGSRISLKEMDEAREVEVRAINTILPEMQHIKSMSGQGNDSASTEFIDPTILNEKRDSHLKHLAVSYSYQDAK